MLTESRHFYNLKNHDQSVLLKVNQKPKERIFLISISAQSSIKAPKRKVGDLGVSHSFSWNSKFLQNLKLLISTVMLKNYKESRHEFFEPRNILGNKIQLICERVIAVPTSCSSSEA